MPTDNQEERYIDSYTRRAALVAHTHTHTGNKRRTDLCAMPCAGRQTKTKATVTHTSLMCVVHWTDGTADWLHRGLDARPTSCIILALETKPLVDVITSSSSTSASS